MRKLAEFKLSDGSYNFEAVFTGKHIIAITGGFSARAYNVFTVFSKATGEQIEVKSRLPYTSLEYGVKSVEMFQFEIYKVGQYELRINNAATVQVKPSQLIFAQLFQSPVKQHDVSVLILSRGY